MAIPEEKTVAYYEGVQGWPSFYSFIPEGMVSLNNRFFSFKLGRIWEHNINPNDSDVPRNTFYREDLDSSTDPNAFSTDPDTTSESKPSVIEFVFNDEPSIVKNFKAFAFEGDGDWDLDISSDQESRVTDADAIPVERSISAEIKVNDWVDREGKNYGYVRGTNSLPEANDDGVITAAARATALSNVDLDHFSIQGIGQITNVSARTITLPEIPSDLAIDDQIFYFTHDGDDSDGTPTFESAIKFMGAVNIIDRTQNTVTVGTRYVGSTEVLPYTTNNDFSNDDFVLFSKDRVAETSGVIGFYATARFTNTDNTEKAELFAVDAEIDLSSGN